MVYPVSVSFLEINVISLLLVPRLNLQDDLSFHSTFFFPKTFRGIKKKGCNL